MIETDKETTQIRNEYHINHVEHFYPNATTVTNYYGDGHKASACGVSSVPSASSVLTGRQRDDILSYVGKLTKHVAQPYLSNYERLWCDILVSPEVAADIYNPGKQQGTTFNRNLVANIIGTMKQAGLFGTITDTRLTELLEGDKDHSVRASLATPPSRVIYNEVRARIENLKV